MEAIEKLGGEEVGREEIGKEVGREELGKELGKELGSDNHHNDYSQ